jgi:PAS domain S-box-containing protein
MTKVQAKAESGRPILSGTQKRYARVEFSILIIFLGILLAPAQTLPNAHSVLIVNTFSDLSLDNVNYIESAMRARGPGTLNFYVEYLESWRLGDAGYEEAVFKTLEHDYRGQKLDIISTVSYPALQFVLKYRDRLFPGVPIVFWGLDASRVGEQRWPGVTGVTETVDVRGTVDLALHLHPEANTVAIITNNSDFDKFWLNAVHTELLRHKEKVRVIDLIALPTDQLLQKVDALPSQTVVLYQPSPQESVQPAMGIYDILSVVGRRFPTYCIFPMHCVNHGGIGGISTDMETQARFAAEISRRVLSGERPEDIPVMHDSRSRARVDWRQLQRWNVSESALPPNSIVFFRSPTLWERYRGILISAIVVLVIQAFLIAGLLYQRARKRKAEAVLRESEKRFRVMANTTPSLIWMCDTRAEITYLNDRWIAFTGTNQDAGYGNLWSAGLHPDDVKRVTETLFHALKVQQPFSNEFRLRRSDNVYRWMFNVGSPRVNGDGSFAGFIGSTIDTTDQKLAQQALEKVSGQLLEAQEKERSRIARDLHDDICQRLALLSMELERVNRSPSGISKPVADDIRQIRRQCSEIADDVQSLSHQLHSSKLDYLGIAAAIKGYCRELSKQHDVDIEFTAINVPVGLPKNISLCLFRVGQEALHNSVKYSGTSRYTVELRGMSDRIQLKVNDSGAGFDVEEARKNPGLGLVSMQERVHLVSGSISVESKRGEGTTILVNVPIAQNGSPSHETEVEPASTVQRF